MRITESRLREVIRQVIKESMNELGLDIEKSPKGFRGLGYRQVKVKKPLQDREGKGYMIVQKRDTKEFHVLVGEGHFLKNLSYCGGPFLSLEAAESSIPFDDEEEYDRDSKF